jgi:hypothetical protein
MTIRDLSSGKAITGVLSRGDRGRSYDLLCSRLSSEELCSIRDTLDQRIEGKRIETSAWIPGSDWSGTVYHPIWEKGARKNHELSGMMFGLLVWEAFERHPDDWYTERFSMGGDEDRFRVYFKAET